MTESLILKDVTIWHFIITFIIVALVVFMMAAGKQIFERIGDAMRRSKRGV